jgi:hypothetical protein
MLVVMGAVVPVSARSGRSTLVAVFGGGAADLPVVATAVISEAVPS